MAWRSEPWPVSLTFVTTKLVALAEAAGRISIPAMSRKQSKALHAWRQEASFRRWDGRQRMSMSSLLWSSWQSLGRSPREVSAGRGAFLEPDAEDAFARTVDGL